MSAPRLLRQSTGKKVSLDMDDTLSRSWEAIIQRANTLHGKHWKLSDLAAWNPTGWKGSIKSEEFKRLHGEIWTTDPLSIRPAIKQESLLWLASRYEVDILTWRPSDHEPFVKHWLNFYFPHVPLEVRIVKSPEAKLDAGYDALFDDGNPIAEELIRRKDDKTVLFLIDRPWNHKERYERQSPNIIRVRDLSTGIKLLMRNSNPERSRAKSRAIR